MFRALSLNHSLITLPPNHPHLKGALEIANFRAASREITSSPPLKPPLRNIVIGGATYDPDTGFSARDEDWIGSTILFCREKEIGPADDFTVTPLNLLKGQDVLNPEFKVSADILIVAHIVDPKAIPNWKEIVDMVPDGDAYSVSPFHLQDPDEAWRKTAIRMGARLICTYGQDTEINASFFRGSKYIKVATTPIGVVQSLKNGQTIEMTYKAQAVADFALAEEINDRAVVRLGQKIKKTYAKAATVH